MYYGTIPWDRERTLKSRDGYRFLPYAGGGVRSQYRTCWYSRVPVAGSYYDRIVPGYVPTHGG